MKTYRSILIYNLYPLFNWREITAKILATTPHDEIVVHISVPKRNPWQAVAAYRYLTSMHKVKKIYFSLNLKAKGESAGFNKIRAKYDFSKFNLATYTHSKGSSRKRKNTQPIRDWTEYLRYFMVERLDLTIEAFNDGLSLSGVNLVKGQMIKSDSEMKSTFHFSGNFVSINLNKLREGFLTKKCSNSYYSVEAFWGTLCPVDSAYCLHQSTVDHYRQSYPPSAYRAV